MENHIDVLEGLRAMLDEYFGSGLIVEDGAVVKKILGSTQEERETFLRQSREQYITGLVSCSDTKKQYNIESAITLLQQYWTNAMCHYIEANDGFGMDGVVWSLVKIYYSETKKYIALVYYQYLVLPKSEYRMVLDDFSGLYKKEIEQLIIKFGLLTERRVHELETQSNSRSVQSNHNKSFVSGYQSQFPGSESKWESLSNLEIHIEKCLDSVKRGFEIEESEWDYIDGKNKEDFVSLVSTLSKKAPDTYYNAILFVVDHLAGKYTAVQRANYLISDDTPEGIVYNNCINLLESYIGVVLKCNQVMEPHFCLYKLFKEIDADLRVAWNYIMDKMAYYNNVSKNLNMRYQANQCGKCRVRKCFGRYGVMAGKLSYVGDKLDSSLFKAAGLTAQISEQTIVASAPTTSVQSIKELKQAISDHKIDSSGKLLVTCADFVRYCVDKSFFSPHNKQCYWAPIDQLLKTSEGKTITAAMLRQSYQDLLKLGKV